MKRKINTLVIHPEDRSTKFLCPIYAPVKNKTVITGGVTKKEIMEMIPKFDRIMMMGHGSPGGLFSVGQFGQDTRGYVIDDTFAPLLKDKDCVFIWCNADRFVEYHKLKGFYSGMFVSEYGEANYCSIRGVEKGMVEESNDKFAEIVSIHINESPKTLHKSVIQEYGILADTNPIAGYNNGRLYIR